MWGMYIVIFDTLKLLFQLNAITYQQTSQLLKLKKIILYDADRIKKYI